jgi:hypothetical protein
MAVTRSSPTVNDFFSFLMALVTFDFLRNKGPSKDQIKAESLWYAQNYFPQDPCYVCGEMTWFNFRLEFCGWRHVDPQRDRDHKAMPQEGVFALEKERNESETLDDHTDEWYDRKYGRKGS